VGGGLDLSNRLHESVSDNDADVRSRVSLRHLAQSDKVAVGERVGGGAKMELEHEGAGVLFGQRDVDPLLKSERFIGVQSAKVNEIVVCEELSPSDNNYLLLMAESRVHGMFVAPSTSTPSLLFPTPERQNSQGKCTHFKYVSNLNHDAL